jgi:hypothetical protein
MSDNNININLDLSNYTTAEQLQTGLDGKVDKITGKGLSTEDYTTSEKSKLSGIQSGAEVNIQSDWNQTDNAQDDFIKNKPVTSSFSGSLLSFFLFAGASDISGYKKALTSPSSGTAQNSTVAASSGENTIVKFATELNYPNQDFLNSGFFKIHFHASKSSSSGNIKIYAKIYKRDLAGIETLLTTTSLTASELTTSIVDYNCEVYKSTISDLLTTDRIVIEFIAVNSGSGSPTVSLFYENGYDSRFDIPVTAVDPNLFEKTENKTNSITGNETSTVKFPAVKAIIDYFTGARIRSILGVSTLSGSNTGDQDLSGYATTANLANKLPYTIAVTGSNISFDTPKIYNTPSAPSTADLTNTLSGSMLGVVQKIYSNKSVEPTYPAGWVKVGTGTYTAGALNIIFVEWVSGTRCEYWITKPAS